VRASLSLESFFRAFSAFILFECCPTNRSFGPAAPWYYLSAGSLVPRIALSGLHRLYIIRVRALLSIESLFWACSALVLFKCRLSCPSNRSFRLSSPLYYSSAGSLVPRIALAGLQHLVIIRVRVLLSLELLHRAFSALFECRLLSPSNCSFECGLSCPSNCFIGPSTPYSSADCLVPQIALLGLQRLHIIRDWAVRSLESLFRAVSAFILSFPKCGSSEPVRMSYVKLEGKSTIGNTRWPGIRIKRALPRKFPCLRREEMHRWMHRVPHNYWASTR
jgi:hypothetical protein